MKKITLFIVFSMLLLAPATMKAGKICGSVGAFITVNWCIGWGEDCKGRKVIQGTCMWSPEMKLPDGTVAKFNFDNVVYGEDKQGFLMVNSLKIVIDTKSQEEKEKLEKKLNSKETIKMIISDMNQNLLKNKIYKKQVEKENMSSQKSKR